jgi:chromosome segregation ATPase
VVNQLARGRELDVQRLIKAGETLERAQREAISDGDWSGFETARREVRDATRRLLDAAEKMLPSASGSTLDRVAKTLRAAAATPEGRRLVKKGRLTEDLEPPGFEALTGLAEPSAARTRSARSENGEGKQRQRRIETLRQRKQKAESTADERSKEAAESERRAREAAQTAEMAKRTAVRARKRADDAAAEARHLKDELTELQGRKR